MGKRKRGERRNRRDLDISAKYPGMTNKRMTDRVYLERRRAIDAIYKVKALLAGVGVTLPRITVRITNDHECGGVLGVGRHGANTIWITNTSVRRLNDDEMLWTVMHEIGHTTLSLGHSGACPLMCPCLPATVTAADLDAAKRALVEYFTAGR